MVGVLVIRAFALPSECFRIEPVHLSAMPLLSCLCTAAALLVFAPCSLASPFSLASRGGLIDHFCFFYIHINSLSDIR